MQKLKDRFLCILKLKYRNYQNDKNIKKHTPSKSLEYIAEILFGSYSEQLNFDYISKDELQMHLNKIEKRHSCILYIINNGIISFKSMKSIELIY